MAEDDILGGEGLIILRSLGRKRSCWGVLLRGGGQMRLEIREGGASWKTGTKLLRRVRSIFNIRGNHRNVQKAVYLKMFKLEIALINLSLAHKKF